MSVIAPPLDGYLENGTTPSFPVSLNVLQIPTAWSGDPTADYRIDCIRPPLLTGTEFPGAGSQIYAASGAPMYLYFRLLTLDSFITFTTGGALSVSVTWATLNAQGFPAPGQRVHIRGLWDAVTDTHSMFWRAANRPLEDDTGWTLAGSTVRAGNSISTAVGIWTLNGTGGATAEMQGRTYRFLRKLNGVTDIDVIPGIDARNLAAGEVVTFTPTKGGTVTVVRRPNVQSFTFPGTTGAYLSTLDTAVLDATGDLSLSALLNPTTWNPGVEQTIIGKWVNTLNQRSYRLDLRVGGFLQLFWSTTGADNPSALSTAAVSGGEKYIAAVLDAVNVATTGSTTFFWTSADGVNWTALGAPVNGAIATIFNSDSPIAVGAHTNGASLPFSGTIKEARMAAAIGAGGLPSTLSSWAISRRSARPVSTPTTVTSDVGHVVTVNGAVTVTMDPTPDVMTVVPFQPKAYYGSSPILRAYLGATPVDTIYSDAA